MPNLKQQRGTFKGILGECLFALENSDFLITSFHPKLKYLPRMRISYDKRNFLMENWRAFDSVHYKGNHIVEIKTRNKYNLNLKYKPKTTQRTHNLLLKAQELGFKVSLCTVWLKDNWEYFLEITNYNPELVYIDRPKKYDAGRGNRKR